MKINNISNLSILNNFYIKTKSINNFKTKPLKYDSVSFSAKREKLDIDEAKANKVIKQLAASTSGLRAPYMSDIFNPETVNLITLGVAQYAKNHEGKHPAVLIGGDTRKATRESLPEIRDILANQGVNVYYIENPIPTPLLALAANKYDLDISILMTASHNPWQDGGFNFVTREGAVAPSEVTQEISQYMDTIVNNGIYKQDFKHEGKIYDIYPYDIYKQHLESLGLIDFEKIASSDIKVYYDGMQGTGTYVMPRLMDDYNIPYEEIKSSGQTGPHPTSQNLSKLEKTVLNAQDNLKIGLANDGDADRFGIIDENGNYIDPNDILLLVAHHLINNKGLRGDIVRSQATSQQLDWIANKYNLKTHVTPVGFKYIASDIIEARNEGRDIIVAGEESGGLTAYGHIPEKDGILADFLLLDLMAYENKPIGEILKDVKKNLDVAIYTDNYSKRLEDDEKKEEILKKVEQRFAAAILDNDLKFGEMHNIDKKKTISDYLNIKKYKENGDGFKFVMTDNSTVLVRKSGTEPLLRFYIESVAKDSETAKEGAISLKEYIEKNFN